MHLLAKFERIVGFHPNFPPIQPPVSQLSSTTDKKLDTYFTASFIILCHSTQTLYNLSNYFTTELSNGSPVLWTNFYKCGFSTGPQWNLAGRTHLRWHHLNCTGLNSLIDTFTHFSWFYQNVRCKKFSKSTGSVLRIKSTFSWLVPFKF